MWSILLAIAVAQTTSSGGGQELDRGEEVILVIDLQAIAVDVGHAVALTSRIAQVVTETSAYRVMTVADLNQMIEMQKTLTDLGCADESCIAELTRVANAKYVVSGSIGRVGEEFTLALSLLDVATSTPAGSASATGRQLADIEGALGETVSDLLGELIAGGEKKQRYRLPEGRTVSLAIFDLKALGIDANIANNLTEVLAAEVKAIEGTTVVSRSDIASMLKMAASKVALDCEENDACLAEIGGALGVDQMIVGDVGRVGESFVVSLRNVDARNPRALSRVNESFEGLESQLVPAVKHAARALLGVEATDPAALHVEASEAAASVSLDGEVVGVLPLQPLHELPAGRRSLLVTKPGFVDWRSDVYLAANGMAKIWVEMEEKPVQWVFWAFVGVTAAAAIGGAVTGGLAFSEDQSALAAYQEERCCYKDHLDTAHSLGLASNVFWVGTGVLAAGTLVAGLLTNWE